MVSVAASGDVGAFAVGERIGGYRLEAKLGEGGMAAVFLAVDERLGRQVALKILAPGLATDAAFRHRFVRESQAAAAVDDPHIIPVYEAGSIDGVLFIAMRYVSGGDVRSLIAREGPVAPARAIPEIISPVALALDTAHAAGLVHRDVKPANMLIDARPGRPDHVYLTDFGITKLSLPSAEITQTGQFVGTLDYVAPEQIEGKSIDGRADQYSLACSAFEILAGSPPFIRTQGLAVIFAHLSESPPHLTSRRPGSPAAADRVLSRALAKDPADRYHSCREFADALLAAFELMTEADRRRAWAAPPGASVVAEPMTAAAAAAAAALEPAIAAGPANGARPATDPGHLYEPGPWPTAGGAARPTIPPAWLPEPGQQTVIAGPSTRAAAQPPAGRRRRLLTAWLRLGRWLAIVLRAVGVRPRAAAPAGTADSSGFPAMTEASPRRPGSRTLDVRLKPSFRYVHEPSRAGEDALPSLGHELLTEELRSRILHSRGGTFLITGFRGVGKSTLVLRALDGITSRNGKRELVLPVVLSVARATTTERLLFAIVRRVFETLNDSGVLGELPTETRHALLVAYMRTSLSFKETQSETRERSAGLDLSIGPGKAMKAVADFTVPKISMSAKRSRALETEAAFLAYSETDVEYDLMRIVSLVDQEAKAEAKRGTLVRRLRRPDHQDLGQLHLVIVLDEVDKLTIDQAGIATIEDLLTGIKNVLTMPGVHFLIVAGPDLHDRAIRDVARGNGVYESVFGWRMYVPCIWDSPDRLIADIISSADAEVGTKAIESLTQYLRFKARGVPRRLLQEVNSFVVWKENCPRLRISALDMDRVEFYARLERILRDYFEASQRRRLFPVAIDEDRWRLGGYYVVDWVLQSEGEPFSAVDLLREGEEADFDPLLRISRRNLDRLLDHLAKNGVLEVVREMNPMATVIGGIAEAGATVFRLADDIRLLLYGFAARHETERVGHDVSLAAPPDSAPDQYANLASRSPRVIGGRYEVGDLLRQGGITSVYKGRDVITSRPVEVKLLRPALSDDQAAQARFDRDAEILQRLSHPQIVQVYDVFRGPEQDPAVITEWLRGPSLQQLIADEGPMPPSQVAACGRILAEVLEYLAGAQVVRLDLKPSTIVMADRGPVIVELGIAVTFDITLATITRAGQFVGTPEFMAPELLEGHAPDSQCDIYSLGLILYYCLTGKTPWEGTDGLPALMMAARADEIDMTGLAISAEFQEVLSRAAARDRASRFSRAADLRNALTETPEYRSLAAGPSLIDEVL